MEFALIIHYFFSMLAVMAYGAYRMQRYYEEDRLIRLCVYGALSALPVVNSFVVIAFAFRFLFIHKFELTKKKQSYSRLHL